MIAIIPNELRSAIEKKLSAAFLKAPEAQKDKDIYFNQLLEYFDEHGEIPDFELIRKDAGKRKGGEINE
jgi:hypothetical protein